MSFDFFNPSHLAFGSKLTKAFNQLNRLCNEAEDNMDDLFRIYESYGQYINRNYPAPFPNRPDAPCRTNELFDLINDANTLKEAYISESGNFHCAVNLFKRSTNRFTVASGYTTKKNGYAFVQSSISNQNPERTIQFVDNYSEGNGNFLFRYRIDSDNNINIVGNTAEYFLPAGIRHITGMQKGSTFMTDVTLNQSYTAPDYECVICVGYLGVSGWSEGSPNGEFSCLDVRVNGKQICYNTGRNCKQYIVVYLKPNDVLSGRFKYAFKVKYTQVKNPDPTPYINSFDKGFYKYYDRYSSPTYSNLYNSGEVLTIEELFPSATFIHNGIIGGEYCWGVKLKNASNGNTRFNFTANAIDNMRVGAKIYSSTHANSGRLVEANVIYTQSTSSAAGAKSILIPEGHDFIVFNLSSVTYPTQGSYYHQLNLSNISLS